VDVQGSVAQVEAVAMEDRRFSDASRIKKKHLKELGLFWFAEHIDEGYFVEEAIAISKEEQHSFSKDIIHLLAFRQNFGNSQKRLFGSVVGIRMYLAGLILQE